MEIKEKIITLLKGINRVKESKLIEDLDKLGYFDCPASTKRHGSFKGGLAIHSYKVYETLKKMNDIYNLQLSNEFIVISTLLHDVCKLGTYELNTLKNGSVSESKPYKWNDIYPIGHGEKSVMLLMNYFELKPEEALAIRYHMGMFTYDTIQSWSYISDTLSKTPYYKHVISLFIADYLSTSLLE